MSFLFQELDNLIKTETAGKNSLTISETLKYKNVGDSVIVGGRIKNVIVFDDLEPVNVFIDDGIGEVRVCVYPQIYSAIKERFLIDNVIIVKGYISDVKVRTKHPEFYKEDRKYISCTAARVVE